MPAIGFVGLGIMGRGMARNLLRKLDSPVVAWNRTCDATLALAAEFPDKVRVARSSQEVVEACKVTYTMLSTPEASEAVVLS
jgi:3-hydroxyisobutyrate dehydrogenase-like beta-hydroxyacid dehydrogenase